MALKRENIDRFFDYNVLLDTRTIVLADGSEEGVDDNMANGFLKSMHVLEYANHNPIFVTLKSMGGCVFNGMAIYDSIHNSACHVTITAHGAAMSMGAIILQAADDRVMQPHALLMIHDGTFGMDTDSRSFENWGMVSKVLRKQMYDLFAQKTGRTVRYWEKKCESDSIFTAEQALAEKLIDRIAGRAL